MPIRSLAWASCLVAIAAFLAGCSDSAPPKPVLVEDPLTLHILPGGLFQERGGPWYSPSVFNVTGPARVRIVNDDDAWHQIIGVPGDDKAPEWVTKAAPGAHSHGLAGLAFDVSLEGGQSVEVEVTRDGPIQVHCHPHPWMTGLWNVQLNGTHDYPISVNSLSLTGESAATVTTAEPAKEFLLKLESPNLAELRVNLTWQDGGDDGELGPDGNQPDTLRVTLVDPTGKAVVNETKTARDGNITLVYATPMPQWPPSVSADGFENAKATLDALHPDSMQWSGDWKIVITLVAAPGPVPDDAGTLNPLAITDGQQAFIVDFDAIHEWPAISAPVPVQVHGTIEAT